MFTEMAVANVALENVRFDENVNVPFPAQLPPVTVNGAFEVIFPLPMILPDDCAHAEFMDNDWNAEAVIVPPDTAQAPRINTGEFAVNDPDIILSPPTK